MLVGECLNMKKIKFTNNSNIRLGFEIECCITSGNFSQFKREVKYVDNSIIVGNDGSIDVEDDFDRPVELRTTPLPPEKAMENLQKLFELVNEYGYTNWSCGFHVNISSKSKRDMKKFNPISFFSNPILNNITFKFRRGNNDFCQPLPVVSPSKMSKLKLIENMGRLTECIQDKYYCGNMVNWQGGTRKSSRVEIRGIGNKDYTKKYSTIYNYINKINKLFSLCCKSEFKIPVFKV